MWRLLLFVFITSSNYLFAQSTSDFIEVKVNQGTGYSIRLVREGMICKALIAKKNGSEFEKIVFFRWAELNRTKVMEIQKYINDNKLLDRHSIDPPDSVVYSDHGTISLGFFPLSDNSYHLITYKYCEPEIDEFIIMLNNLVPKKYSSYFHLITKCKH